MAKRFQRYKKSYLNGIISHQITQEENDPHHLAQNKSPYNQGWEPAPMGWFEINFNYAVRGNPRKESARGVI